MGRSLKKEEQFNGIELMIVVPEAFHTFEGRRCMLLMIVLVPENDVFSTSLPRQPL